MIQTINILKRSSLADNLRAVLPALADKKFEVSTYDLASNASFVNYVRHHTIRASDHNTYEIVEKSIRKFALLSSQEARFHREHGMLNGSLNFSHPECLGVIETPFESLIFSSFVDGKPPRIQRIGRQLATGISELEDITNLYIKAQPVTRSPLFWCMDFFRPWFLIRPRFNFQRCLPALAERARNNPDFQGLFEKFCLLRPSIQQMAQEARHSPACISHMDYLRKNLIVSGSKLYLIDWSEVKIGRVGFDGGAYLGSLFRRKEMDEFLTAQTQFNAAYAESLAPRFDLEEAMRNQRYIFLQTALFHCLRPETIQEYQELDRMPLLLEKYEHLLSL